MGKTIIIIFLFVFFCKFSHAQFEPAAGLAGSSAIHKDSNIFVGWASSCVLQNGWMDCMNPSLGYAGPNDPILCTGIADGIGVASLGDGGMVTLQFSLPITNGPGNDFAVFENSFSNDFLELAFVEVSSDGNNFYRFPSVSYTSSIQQTGTFGLSNPEQIHNLAGKYRASYGTPFNLDDLDTVLNLDINRITHVRIIDVVGCINCENYSNYDALGNIINDPYPTPFAQGGFDLDAVGVMHFAPQGIVEAPMAATLNIYPNPMASNEEIRISWQGTTIFQEIMLSDLQGRIVYSVDESNGRIQVPSLNPGVYILSGTTAQNKNRFYSKINLVSTK
jgi:hypothetical protein